MEGVAPKAIIMNVMHVLDRIIFHMLFVLIRENEMKSQKMLESESLDVALSLWFSPFNGDHLFPLLTSRTAWGTN